MPDQRNLEIYGGTMRLGAYACILDDDSHAARAYGGVVEWNLTNVFEIYAQWRHRYPPGTTHNTEHVFALGVGEPVAVTLSPREHRSHQWLPWQEAAAKWNEWQSKFLNQRFQVLLTGPASVHPGVRNYYQIPQWYIQPHQSFWHRPHARVKWASLGS